MSRLQTTLRESYLEFDDSAGIVIISTRYQAVQCWTARFGLEQGESYQRIRLSYQ